MLYFIIPLTTWIHRVLGLGLWILHTKEKSCRLSNPFPGMETEEGDDVYRVRWRWKKGPLDGFLLLESIRLHFFQGEETLMSLVFR